MGRQKVSKHLYARVFHQEKDASSDRIVNLPMVKASCRVWLIQKFYHHQNFMLRRTVRRHWFLNIIWMGPQNLKRSFAAILRKAFVTLESAAPGRMVRRSSRFLQRASSRFLRGASSSFLRVACSTVCVYTFWLGTAGKRPESAPFVTLQSMRWMPCVRR